MRQLFTVLLFVCLTLPLDAHAQAPGADLGLNGFEARFRTIEEDVDRVNATQDAKITDLTEATTEQRRRIERFNEDYQRLREALSAAEALQADLTTLTADVATAKDDATRAYEASNSSRWIVSIAAILITGMTAALGLLFSQRFIDLKADSRVAQEVLIRVEKRVDEATREDQALAEISQRLEAILAAQRNKTA